MKEMINKIKDNSIFRFLVVGGSSTGIDFVLYMLISIRVDISISKGISMVISSIYSYIMNKRFTFKDNNKTDFFYIVKYYFVFALNLGANIGTNYLLFTLTGYKILAYLIATFVGMSVNYLGQRFLVFKK